MLVLVPSIAFGQYGSGPFGSGVYGGSAPDTVPPTLTLVTPVPTPSSDTTPSFVFSSSESGTITYTGGCSSNVNSANAGNNSVTLTALPPGTYSTCRLSVRDAAGNNSSQLTINTFTITSPAPGATFTIGDHVRTTATTTVRGTLTGSSIGTQPTGSFGYVTTSEQSAGGTIRVRVNFKRGVDGFVDISSLATSALPVLNSYTTEVNTVQRGQGKATLSHQNSTDLNADGVDDREELRVWSLQNKVRTDRGRYNSLILNGVDTVITEFRNLSESDLQTDSRRDFPVGLFEFTATVVPGSTETITLVLDEQYDTSAWTYRKFNDDTDRYETIDVTYGTALVGGVNVTTVTYTVEDNGPLDLDDRLGFVRDPAGPSVAVSLGSSSGGGGGSSSRTLTNNDADDSDTTTSLVTPPPDTSETLNTANFPQWYRFNSNISFVQPQFNDPVAVRYLEQFLNVYEGETLPLDGVYGAADLVAVKRFQQKYARSILDIWNLDEATGFVGLTTRLKMNFIIQNEVAQCPVFVEFNGGRDGIFRSDEVRRTQEILRSLDLYAGEATGFWDPFTHEAMVDFQELFHEVMLDPWGISQGTGYKYKTTNKFLNYFVGCDTPAVELEGVGIFDF